MLASRNYRGFNATLVLILLIAPALGACSARPRPDQQGRAAAQASRPSAGFPLTIMADLKTSTPPSRLLADKLAEKTHTALKIQWVPDSNYNEKMETAMATGAMPQALYIKNESAYVILKKSIRQGMFWEIGPLLQAYPHLSRLNPEVLANTAVDGKIYALYQERPLSRQGVIYRKDWADKLGLAAPKTTEDLAAMMKAFSTGDPDGNGLADTTGLADRNDLVYGAFKTLSSYFGTPNNWGWMNGELVPEFLFPQYRTTMDYMKHLWSNGWMNKDFPEASKEEQQNLFINGKAGVYIGSMADVQTLHDKAAKLNPKAAFALANRISAPGGKPGVWAIPGYESLVLFPKSAIPTEADLKKILGFFDYLMSPEGYNLLQYGVKGTNYQVLNGAAVPYTDAAHLRLMDKDVRAYLTLEIGGPDTISGELLPRYTYPVKQEAMNLIADNEHILIQDPTAALDSPTYTVLGPELDRIIQYATYNYILGVIHQQGFDQAVADWRAQGGDRVIREYNEAYRRLHPTP